MEKEIKLYISKIKAYAFTNKSVPFIMGFILLLSVSAVSLAGGLWQFAQVLGSCAYFVLVIGVILQLAPYFRIRKRIGEVKNAS
jgi:hypothetical protein